MNDTARFFLLVAGGFLGLPMIAIAGGWLYGRLESSASSRLRGMPTGTRRPTRPGRRVPLSPECAWADRHRIHTVRSMSSHLAAPHPRHRTR